MEEIIDLQHRIAIDNIRRKYGHDTSSHSFQILYIWRKQVGELLHLEQDMYTVQYALAGEYAWLFPCGDPQATEQFIRAHMADEKFQLYFLRSQDVAYLEEHFPGEFYIEEDQADTEYILDRRQHVELEGHAFGPRRKQIRRCEREHRIRIEALHPGNLQLAANLTRKWIGGTKTEGILHIHGNEVDRESLLQMQELDLTGILMYVDDIPYGVAAGFPLSDDTYDMYLSKATSLEGHLGYYLDREMIKSIPEQYTYVNMEEDLGIEGLRVMKERLKPVKKNRMWKASYVNC